MPDTAILIVSRSPAPLKERLGNHLRCIHVQSMADAVRMAADAGVFDLLLFVANAQRPNQFLLMQELMSVLPHLKVMIVGNQKELNSTLDWLSALEPASMQLFGQKRQNVAQKAAQESSEPPPSSDESLCGLIGESSEMVKLKTMLLKIAPTGTTILLQGESGTGKELIARAIHQNSSRSDKPFIPVDCAAINASIIESELFGHAKGAFTGADRSTLGMIRSADKGRLFLDEIGELPLNMQAKLLRTLQERTVKAVGDSKLYPVDIRIIAATNRNLGEAVKSGEFRQDLYYRLNAITIYAPPLRERLSDIAPLSMHILKRLAEEGYPEKSIEQDALDLLSSHDWPGNVRELDNVLRRALTLSNGELIDSEAISFDGQKATAERSEEKLTSVAYHEKEAIQKALQRTAGNRRAAAELLSISEATLYRRLKSYNL